jgi:hypothetical protein
MVPPIDPMSSEAQEKMEVFAAKIRTHASKIIRESRDMLRKLNDQRSEE